MESSTLQSKIRTPSESELEWKLLKEGKFPGLEYKEKKGPQGAKYVFYEESEVCLHLTAPKREGVRTHISTEVHQWLYWAHPDEMGLVEEGKEVPYEELEELISPSELLDTFETLEKIINYLRPEGVPDI